MSTIYHPMRFATVKKRRAERANRGKAELQRRILAGITDADLDEVSSDRSHLAAYEEKEGLTADLTTGWREEIYDRIQRAVGSFGSTGANIFDMAKIAPLLARTDVDDIDLDDTPLPYPAFYLHFGRDAGLAAPIPGMHLEGAYVRQIDPADTASPIEVTFVCNHPDHENVTRTPLGDTWKRMTSAIGTVIHRDRTVGTSIEQEGFAGDPEMEQDAALIAAAIRMTVNGILYLSTPKADVEAAWPADAPAALVASAEDRKHWIADPARTRLAEQGYGRVNFVGRSIARRYERALTEATGDTLPPHWRRGHYRRVVYGEGRALRQWRWFLPVIVNQHLGTPKNGRVYDVDPDNGPRGPGM